MSIWCFATQGSNRLTAMFGDGKGHFLEPISSSVAGGVTALAAYRPGVPLSGEAVIVGYESNGKAGISILSNSGNGLLRRSDYPLPGVATAISVASLNADLIPDIAVVTNGKLLILDGKGAISGKAEGKRTNRHKPSNPRSGSLIVSIKHLA